VKEEQFSPLAKHPFGKKCILKHGGSNFSKVRTKTHEQQLLQFFDNCLITPTFRYERPISAHQSCIQIVQGMEPNITSIKLHCTELIFLCHMLEAVDLVTCPCHQAVTAHAASV